MEETAHAAPKQKSPKRKRRPDTAKAALVQAYGAPWPWRKPTPPTCPPPGFKKPRFDIWKDADFWRDCAAGGFGNSLDFTHGGWCNKALLMAELVCKSEGTDGDSAEAAKGLAMRMAVAFHRGTRMAS